MKRYRPFGQPDHRYGTLWGIVGIFFSCAMLGGADPVAQIEAAQDVRAKLEAAHQEESVLPLPDAPAAPEAEPSSAGSPESLPGSEAGESDY